MIIFVLAFIVSVACAGDGGHNSYCLSHSDCNSTLYCDPIYSRCFLKMDELASCLADEYCISDICSCSRCRERRGECCADDGSCSETFYCDTENHSITVKVGSCYELIDDGEPCMWGDSCKSGVCHYHTCLGEMNSASRF